jgi:hypothetical protein
MVGVCRGIFYKGVGEESGATYSWWKNFEVQVRSLSKEFSKFYLW